jgi:ABC-type branched-subunit amino acid transport system ATPase component
MQYRRLGKTGIEVEDKPVAIIGRNAMAKSTLCYTTMIEFTRIEGDYLK